jgi:hypothetical protein
MIRWRKNLSIIPYDLNILKLVIMKNLFIISFIIWGLSCKAQINLEHYYPNAKSSFTQGNFEVVNIGPSGYKYASIDSSKIELYNLDHSLFLNISIPASVTGPEAVVFFITEALFDNDSTNIEYLIDNLQGSVSIVRDDGTILMQNYNITAFSLLTSSYSPALPMWFPLAVTDQGVKLMLQKYIFNWSTFNIDPDGINVYGLPGKLPLNYQNNLVVKSNDFIASANKVLKLSGYPNPSFEKTTINFELPEGISEANLVIYNMKGIEIKRLSVNKSFTSIVLDTDSFSPGTYYYQLVLPNGMKEGMKLVIVK